MSLKEFFRKIGQLFRKANDFITQVDAIVPEALQIVEAIAAATPTRSDDEIIRLAKNYGYGAVTAVDLMHREDLLRSIARVALQPNVRDGIKDNILNAALEIALGIHKS